MERTAAWIERVGLSYVRERVVDDDRNREALYRRFLEAQRTAQVDPWAERVRSDGSPGEFQPLRKVG